MLETIREYGLEQLAASDDVAAVREQHAAWVLAFATRTEPELLQAEQQLGVASLEAERPNIRAALAWLEQISDAERAQRLASVLTIFIYMSGHFREGQEWLRRALAIPGDSSPLARASALWGSGVLAWFRGEYDAARAVLEQSLAVSREKDFLLGVARAKHALAITSWMQGDLEQALVLGEEGVAIYRAVAQPQWLAILLPDLGTMALLAGDDEQGRAWSAEGLAINRELGNRWNTANHLSDLGVVAQSRGDLDEAAHHYAESVRLFRDLGDTWYVASPLAGLASIAVVQGYPKVAARLLGVAEALRVASGATVFTSEQERDEQTAAAARAALGDAAYARAVAAGRSMRIEQAVDEAMTIVGDVADDLGTA
jgi:tetratricopeptide (TPR) repeat protein